MLVHHNTSANKPSRVVVLGAKGFIGSALVDKLNEAEINALTIGRKDINLLEDSSAEELASFLKPEDSLVVISAEAPVKNNEMLERNIKMVSSVCKSLESISPEHIVYVSSDAVYADSMDLLNEKSCAQPGSLHGVMHLTRETMLRESYSGLLGIIRPTLIYGADDPHNGYGPNRFRRLVENNEDIALFGKGEEQRDHIHVGDVAELILNVLLYRSQGILNAATGNVISFHEIAEEVLSLYDNKSKISYTDRVGAMPHNGYRAFDPAATFTAFPGFEYMSIKEGLKKVYLDTVKS